MDIICQVTINKLVNFCLKCVLVNCTKFHFQGTILSCHSVLEVGQLGGVEARPEGLDVGPPRQVLLLLLSLTLLLADGPSR